MRDALMTILPMIAFMLIPMWIPVVAVTVGSLFDLAGRLLRGPGAPAR